MDMMKSLARLRTFNSAELSDALDAHGVEGALLHIKPLTSGTQLIGPAYTVKYQPYDKRPEGFNHASDYIDAVPAGSVIVIDNQGRDDCTVWGGILTYVAEIKNIAGAVVNGAVRDLQRIRELKFPLFCHSIYMRTGRNRVYKSGEQCPLEINGVCIRPDDIIFADDNGVLVIPRHLLDAIIEKAHNIRLTEQHIIQSVQAGSSLEEARKTYQYNTPWVMHHDEDS